MAQEEGRLSSRHLLQLPLLVDSSHLKVRRVPFSSSAGSLAPHCDCAIGTSSTQVLLLFNFSQSVSFAGSLPSSACYTGTSPPPPPVARAKTLPPEWTATAPLQTPTIQSAMSFTCMYAYASMRGSFSYFLSISKPVCVVMYSTAELTF
jgi:hypothetical protein